MSPGDLLYSNVCTQPLVVLVRRGDGQFFDFKAGAFAADTKPLDTTRFCLAMTPDALLPTTRRCVVPVAAANDPQAELIEATMQPGGFPAATQSFWIGPGGDGTPFSRATGCVVRFTG